MYKLQIYNALTNELFREKTYKKSDLILSLFESAEKGQECLLFDEGCRLFKGIYVSHSIFTEKNSTVYKMFFQLKLSDIQARIAK